MNPWNQGVKSGCGEDLNSRPAGYEPCCSPDALRGIDLGCICWEILQRYGTALNLDVLVQKLGAMGLQAVVT